MKKLRACAVAVGIACILVVPGAVAFAQNATPPAAAAPRDPQAVALAHEYARIAEITADLSRALPAMSEQIVRSVRQKNPNVPDATFKVFSEALFEEFLLKRAGEIETAVANVLTDTYTKEELKALRDFYSTAMGRSILQKQLTINSKIPAALQEWVRRAAPEAVDAAAARLKASGTELRL